MKANSHFIKQQARRNAWKLQGYYHFCGKKEKENNGLIQPILVVVV